MKTQKLHQVMFICWCASASCFSLVSFRFRFLVKLQEFNYQLKVKALFDK